MEFEAFNKIPRIEKLNDLLVITEKLDGTNACVAFDDAGTMYCGSRNRWLADGKDNFGFRAWCLKNEEELRKLGPGRHYGEWYGRGIGPHGYGLADRRLALFNTRRWGNPGQVLPACVGVVPVIYEGRAVDVKVAVQCALDQLAREGSHAVPGWMRPEGVVLYLPGHDATFKALLYANAGDRKAHPSPIETEAA